jgi:hypothetical protein
MFCDDIRQEVGGKLTLVGVHPGDFIVEGEFPAVIARFAIQVMFIESMETAVGPLVIKVFGPASDGNEVIAEQSLPPDRNDIATASTGGNEYVYNYVSFRLSPLVVQKEGAIKVRAYKGTEEIKLGAITFCKGKHKTSQVSKSLRNDACINS